MSTVSVGPTYFNQRPHVKVTGTYTLEIEEKLTRVIFAKIGKQQYLLGGKYRISDTERGLTPPVPQASSPVSTEPR